MARRLNLLPPSHEAGGAAFLSRLVAPVGRSGTVLVNVGLWYGALARHPAFEHATADSERRAEAARAVLADGVRALVRLACERP
eukprot:2749089-Prymnesium_polylepis.1